MNRELAMRVMDKIEANPAEWNQGSWVQNGMCGTTACFAGHAMLESGYTLTRVKYTNGTQVHTLDLVPAGPDDDDSTSYVWFVDPDGVIVTSALAEGQKLLDLDDEESQRLFIDSAGICSVEMMRNLVKRIADPDEEEWEE